MRIGLTGGSGTVEGIIRQAERAEAEGFAALWYPSAVLGDPLAPIAAAGRATTTLELGTAVLQTYACHPVLQANRAAATVAAIGAPRRFTLGVGPSHEPLVEGMLGYSYDHPGRHTEEYVEVLTRLLRGETVQFQGEDFRVQATAPPLLEGVEIPVLVSALGPRLLRVAGQYAAGTITWMANTVAVRDHIAPRIRRAASDAGRPDPRIVVGFPVAVHDDVAEAQSVAAEQFTIYGQLPNYQHILERGGVSSPAEAAIVGDEVAVTAELEQLLDAGATDLWAAPFAVGDDPSASRSRTRALLAELARA